jgi:hypothetical protein
MWTQTHQTYSLMEIVVKLRNFYPWTLFCVYEPASELEANCEGQSSLDCSSGMLLSVQVPLSILSMLLESPPCTVNDKYAWK